MHASASKMLASVDEVEEKARIALEDHCQHLRGLISQDVQAKVHAFDVLRDGLHEIGVCMKSESKSV